MGWAIAGGVLGIILMFGAYRWAVSWATARAGSVSVPTIGSRPRRLAGVPEEAPSDARMPPAMEVLRQGEAPVVAKPVRSIPTLAGDGEVAGDPVLLTLTDSPAEEVLEDEPVAADEPEIEVVAFVDSGVVVAHINHGSEDSGEYVVVSNSSEHHVTLEGWRLTDEGEVHIYTFEEVVLVPGAEIRIHMWAGEDTETDLYVGRRNRWWNDTGDTAYLYDSAGTLVHSLATHNEDES